MPSQGPLAAGTVTTSNADGGTVDWDIPGNVTASDDSYASASTFSGGELTYLLKVVDFGFSIPVGATIDGVEVTVERSSLLTGTVDARVNLIKNGVVTGVNHADTVTAWPGTDGVVTYGGPTDKWGLVLTRSFTNDSANWGCAMSVTLGTGLGGANVDSVTMTVYYTVAGVGFSPQRRPRRWFRQAG